MKITNALALSVAIANLSTTVDGGAVLYDNNGVNQLSDEDSRAVVERLSKMLETVVNRAEAAKTKERKPTAKEIAAQAETAKLINATFEEMSKRPDFLYECKGIADTMGVSVPKMARVLAFLVNAGKVERIEGKKPNFKVKGE